jgi:hypothetical protein
LDRTFPGVFKTFMKIFKFDFPKVLPCFALRRGIDYPVTIVIYTIADLWKRFIERNALSGNDPAQGTSTKCTVDLTFSIILD